MAKSEGRVAMSEGRVTKSGERVAVLEGRVTKSLGPALSQRKG